LVPFCVEKKISSIAELLNPLGVEVLSIRNCECVVVTDIFSGKPIRNFILVIVFDVTMKDLMVPINPGAASLVTSLVKIGLSGRGGRESFEYEEASEAECSAETSLEDSRIDLLSVEIRPIDLKVFLCVLREAMLIRRTSSSKIDMIDLRHETSKSSWSDIDLVSSVGSASSVDVKTSENFAH
jgi:hypothetical protein